MPTSVNIIILAVLSTILILEYTWYKDAEEWEDLNDREFTKALKKNYEHLEKFTAMKNTNIALHRQNCVIAMSATMIAIVIVLVSL